MRNMYIQIYPNLQHPRVQAFYQGKPAPQTLSCIANAQQLQSAYPAHIDAPSLHPHQTTNGAVQKLEQEVHNLKEEMKHMKEEMKELQDRLGTYPGEDYHHRTGQKRRRM